jgi:hypothetical protein
MTSTNQNEQSSGYKKRRNPMHVNAFLCILLNLPRGTLVRPNTLRPWSNSFLFGRFMIRDYLFSPGNTLRYGRTPRDTVDSVTSFLPLIHHTIHSVGFQSHRHPSLLSLERRPDLVAPACALGNIALLCYVCTPK